jgi:hypothetical protein
MDPYVHMCNRCSRHEYHIRTRQDDLFFCTIEDHFFEIDFTADRIEFISIYDILYLQRKEASVMAGLRFQTASEHCGSWPNGTKLSSITLPYLGFACLSAWSGSSQVSLGSRVTGWGSIHFDRIVRRLPMARIPLTIDEKTAFD